MLVGTTHQSSLFYFAFDREAALIKDDLLEPIDRLLDDGDLIELVREAQAKRAPAARTMGRKTIAPDRLLRCCALKHIKNWSFRELERELRGSLSTGISRASTSNASQTSAPSVATSPCSGPTLLVRSTTASSDLPTTRMSRPARSCAPTPPSSRPTFITPRTARCCRTGSACSPARSSTSPRSGVRGRRSDR
jgi:hypothetical protein